MLRKALKYKPTGEFIVRIHLSNDIVEWGTCDTPELFGEDATIDLIKKYTGVFNQYSEEDIELVTIEINVIGD